MFFWDKIKKSKKEDMDTNKKNANKKQDDKKMSDKYDETLSHMKYLFKDDDLIQFREIKCSDKHGSRFCIIFCDGLVDSELIGHQIIKPLLNFEGSNMQKLTSEELLKQIVEANSGKTVTDYQDIIKAITGGDTFLFGDEFSDGLLFSLKKFDTRGIAEPESEKILSGPREGFNESIMQNMSLVRRRLRTNSLKMRYYSVGRKTITQVCIAYLDDVVDKNILKELYARLDTIDIDGILDSNYIAELIKDHPWSPFNTIGYTERPDVVAGKLLEGRIALFVDGTPVVLTLPYLFIENFQSSEDYYINFYYSSFSRMLRMVGLFLTMFLPSIYIAIVAFHHEALPTPLLISIAIERQKVPLPAALELIVMIMVFEMLLETGIRMPSNVGQALSIVGALVVGQAAVEANLVAAPMIIVVAMTGITSLLNPKMNGPMLFARFGIMALTSSFGLLGIMLGFTLLITHILSLTSFGVWQVASNDEKMAYDLQDHVIRAPWWEMKHRPFQLTKNLTREISKRRGLDE